MQVSTRQGVLTAMVGVLISIFGAIIQFLMIYWILNAYGTEFNGFVRIATALSLIAGSTEGALGVTTVVMLMKPMANNDWIEANEIYSTARKSYHKNILTGSILIVLIAILYPIELAVAPAVLNGDAISWSGIALAQTASTVDGTIEMVPIWELSGIVLILGFKQIISSSVFGIYENVLMADQKNMVRKTAILLADTIVYGLLFYLMNLSIDGIDTMRPIIPFLVLLAYGPIRGFAMMLFVRRYYPWIKYYPDFMSYTLIRSKKKMFRANLGQNILVNVDLLIVFVVLGTSGLRTSSMLSLYLIIGVNVRIIMTNMIVSFREYFIGVISKEGRLYWEAYSKYELYTFVIAAFSFIFISIVSPYIVSGLYGQTVANDLQTTYNNLANVFVPKMINGSDAIYFQTDAQYYAFEFIFTNPTFSTLYAGGTAFILLFQGQTTLIQAKRRFGDVATKINAIAIVYVIAQVAAALIIVYWAGDNDVLYIKHMLMAFYIIKLVFMTVVYVYLWQYTWKNVTYNSTLKYTLANLLSLLLPITGAVLVDIYVIQPRYILEATLDTVTHTISLTQVTIPLLIGMLAVVGFLGIAATLILPVMLRPSVGLSILLSLPGIKQVVRTTQEKSRLRRLQSENIAVESLVGDQKTAMLKAINGFEDANDVEIDEWEFFKKYQSAEKPKIYKVKGVKKQG